MKALTHAFWMAAFVSLLFSMTPDADAADDDVLDFNVFAGLRYDSNLFALPDDVHPFGNDRRSATTQTSGIGLRLDKQYGLQRFDIDASVTHDHYIPYNNLDTTARSITASWAWTLTQYITGNLSFRQSVAPNNFSDTGVQTNSNDRKMEERRFDVYLRPGAALHPRVSLLQNEDKSDQTTIDRQNSRSTSLEPAIVYDFASGNSAQAYFRRGRGNYTDLGNDPSFQFDNQFDEHETGLSAHWVWSGSSTLDGRVGYLDRHHRTFSSRDFSGPVGAVVFTYALTGKTRIQVSGTRSLSSNQTVFSSYSEDETVAINPIWFATAKITVRPNFAVTRRLFRGALVQGVDDLRQTTRDASLQVDYSALRALDVSLNAGKSNRSSNNAAFQYADRFASFNATFRF